MANATKSRLTIRETVSGEVLVDADVHGFREIEGNWYVDPSAARAEHLKVTEHEYRCPYKGRCRYVDFDDGRRQVPRVAWIYDDVEAGWEHIRSKYGFYSGAIARKFGKTSDSIT